MIYHLFWSFLANLIVWKISGIFNLEEFNVGSFKTNIYYFYMAGFQQLKMVYAIIALAMPLIVRYAYNILSCKVIQNIKKETRIIYLN